MEFITVFRVLCFASVRCWVDVSRDWFRAALLFGLSRCALLLLASGFSRPIAPARLLGRCAAAAGMSTASFSFQCVTALYFNTASRLTISPASESAWIWAEPGFCNIWERHVVISKGGGMCSDMTTTIVCRCRLSRNVLLIPRWTWMLFKLMIYTLGINTDQIM